MDNRTIDLLREWAETYNDPAYFREDPIAFPARFAEMEKRGTRCLKDIETPCSPLILPGDAGQ